jgi:membrane fusion protein, heavy metal efflux system
VRVLAQSSQTLTGVPLPAGAVVRNPSNEPSVWLHERAELFRAVPVQVAPLDGRTVVVTGVAAGARVVTDGATLLNQVR